MKPLPTLQLSAIGAVLGLHALALCLLNGQPGRELPVTPPRLLTSMTMLAPAAAPKAAAPSPAAPQKPQVQAKAAPSKAIPQTRPLPAVKPQKTDTPPPAPAKAIQVAAAAPAASAAPAAELAKAPGGGKPDGDSRQQQITEPLSTGGYLNNPQPAYPTVSKEEGEEGTVRLRVHVSVQGLPQEVSVQSSSGFPRLDRAALASVKRWRFIPAKRGAEPIAYTYIVPVEFSLKSSRS
ncbi:TonB family protein [Chromobacterium subtsugae]|uniref:TonB family protein n=1 Tax=Chromobacterium subtsugae TaxID=251747 RepID=A0ABS7FHG1_9NEIS|nr:MULTISPECIES: energy transducer TonB [Chromobacterium]MBW7568129.1 energy transducer TonB [Chromobacterium subtsugae]MBW8289497.1 TonB family protein [Chromobacterium subtsugae]WSE92041.1 TonB family protein [Chromobacterium subtsugae]WVH60415.1 TonB family protein [Chromobacterium subtsugae]